MRPWTWPTTAGELVELQLRLADAADAAVAEDPWTMPAPGDDPPLIGGCFVAFATGEAGPGRPGDRAWAAAVTWRLPARRDAEQPPRSPDRVLVGSGPLGPRLASDIDEQVVVFGTTGAAYVPGLLALREGPLLAAAVDKLHRRPDVLLVDATGRDHPRRAGVAVHLGAVLAIPTVGVTHRPLVAEGHEPLSRRGDTSPVLVAGEEVGRWVRTRSGVRPVVAHAGWRTDPATAAAVVLAASTDASRTPVTLGEARRVASEVRAIAEHRAPASAGSAD